MSVASNRLARMVYEFGIRSGWESVSCEGASGQERWWDGGGDSAGGDGGELRIACGAPTSAGALVKRRCTTLPGRRLLHDDAGPWHR